MSESEAAVPGTASGQLVRSGGGWRRRGREMMSTTMNEGRARGSLRQAVEKSEAAEKRKRSGGRDDPNSGGSYGGEWVGKRYCVDARHSPSPSILPRERRRVERAQSP